MNLLEQSLLIGLAAWRLTSMISWESGPFRVFQSFRSLLGFTHDSKGHPTSWPNGALQEMVACSWCTGAWMAAATYGLWVLEPRAVMVIAAASVVVMVERWNRGSS